MVQEEQQQRCSNSNSGGGPGGGGGGSGGGGGGGSGGCGGSRFSKKPKQKKIPQRGLGVAQLEKIRLEEQQKKDSSSSTSCVLLPLPHNQKHNQSSPIPFPPPCPSNLSPSSGALCRSPSSTIALPNFDLFIPPPPPLPSTPFYGLMSSLNPPQEGGGDLVGGLAAPTTLTRHSYLSNMSNPCEFDPGGDKTKMDPGYAFRSHLSNDFSPPWPSVTMERKHQPPSMVNVPLPASTSSGFNLQMEPPSNQSFYSNYTPHMWPEEEKMVGMKRPWPFSLDSLQGSSLPYKLPQFVPPPINRLDESSSCGNSGLFNFEPGNVVFRERFSGLNPLNVEWRGSSTEMNLRKGSKETGDLDGKFLSLGPPPTTSSSTSSKAKQPLSFPTPHRREFSEYDMVPFQAYTDIPYFGTSGSLHPNGLLQHYSNESFQQQPLYSFFPSKGQQVGCITAKSNDQRSDIGEGHVDLNLKL